MNKSLKNRNNSLPQGILRRNRSGIVLLVTLVLLVVLSTLGYTLSTRVAAQRHRDQYIIDYSSARYGCDSAVKYALATLEDIDPHLIERPNEPDFSDLFYLTEDEYQQLLEQWRLEFQSTMLEDSESFNDMIGINNLDKPGGIEVAISSAEPFKTVRGTLDVPDEEKIARTIAVDRTRKIGFAVEKKEYGLDEEKEEAGKTLSDGKAESLSMPKKTKEIKR